MADHQDGQGHDDAAATVTGPGARPRRRSAVVVGVAVGVVVAGAALAVGPLLAGEASADGASRTSSAGPAEAPTFPSGEDPHPTPPEPTPSWPTHDTNGIRDCSSYPAREEGSVTVRTPDGVTSEVGALDGFWSSFPADPDGGVLPVESWPRSHLEHAVVAQVETSTGTVLATIDRRTCAPLTDYVPPPLDHLPPSTIVVLDVETGEVVEEHPLGDVVP